MQSLIQLVSGAKSLHLVAVVILATTPFISQAHGQSWHNADNPFDVSGDGFLGVDDFHAVISELSFPTIGDPVTGMLPIVPSPPPFLDVNNDGGFHSPIDALLVFNEQNDNGSFATGIPDGDQRVSGPASVSFAFEDSMGNPISQAIVGESFFLKATLNDLRDVPFNIYGAYVDLLFDRTLVQDSFEAQFSDPVFEQPGELTDSGVDEVGSILTPGLILPEPATPGQQDFFTAELTAAASGTFEVTGDDGYVLAFGILDAIDPTFGSATLTIVPEPGSAVVLLVATALMALRRRIK